MYTFTYLPCRVPPPAAYAASTLKGIDLRSSSAGPWISVLQNIEFNTNITNDA
jgi:hypothetical protein